MTTIETFIKHLKQLTAYRDRVLLDVAAVAAIRELLGASQARILKIACINEQLYMQPQVWVENGHVVSMEESLDPAHRGESIDHYPGLAEGLDKRVLKVEATSASGDRIIWLPVWINNRAQACFEVTNLASESEASQQILDGIFSVYRSYQSLLDYSERDSLTGLFNRKTFDEKFSKLLSSPQSTGRNTDSNPQGQADDSAVHKNWIAVLDIDHFKRVNDQFGHLYGDEVLLLIANLLQSSFRGYDKIFRFGGEEFVILLRRATLANAKRVFERFRRRVEQYDFPQVGKVTVSLGFREIAPVAPAMLLGEVDKALYYAKEHGRNQVCHYEELVSRQLIQKDEIASDAEFF